MKQIISDKAQNVHKKLTYQHNSRTLNCGTNRDVSCCQLCSVDAGAIIRNGPQINCDCKCNIHDNTLTPIFSA